MEEDIDIQNLIKEEVEKQLEAQSGFTAFKPTDTPTDSLSFVNRKFVTMSSNLGARPVSSVVVIGQSFFDTTNNTPIWYTIAGWRNSVGSIIAQNN